MMDPLLADEVSAAWLQSYLLVNTILCRLVGELRFGALCEATGICLPYTTWHGMPGEGEPMTPKESADFLTREWHSRTWADSRLIDPVFSIDVLKAVLSEMKKFKRRLPLAEGTEELEILTSDQFELVAYKALSEAMEVLQDERASRWGLLQQMEAVGMADSSLPRLWEAWAKVAPVIPAGLGSWTNDAGYSVLAQLGNIRSDANIEAIESLTATGRALVIRELKRMQLMEKLTWHMERESSLTHKLKQHTRGMRKIVHHFEAQPV